MLKLTGILAAIISPLAAPAGGDPAPIRLVAEPVAQGVRVQVIGASRAQYEASFTLEVASEGNRSLHRGSATLAGGDPVILSAVTVGVAAGRPWRASLRVEPRGRPAYEQVESS